MGAQSSKKVGAQASKMVGAQTSKMVEAQASNTGRKVEFPAIGKVKYSYLTDHMSFTFPTSGQMSWW